MKVRSGLFYATAAFVLGACILHTSDAPACGVAYPQGSFARFSEEKSLIVWDAAKQTEHFVRSLTLKGDPETFGVFVPTPSLPVIAKESDELLSRVEKLFAPSSDLKTSGGGGMGGGKPAGIAPPVEVLQRTQLGDFEAVTLKATDANALGDWLAQNKFLDKPTLRAWEKTYLDKKWLITAIRCTAKGTGDRALEVPTMRMSFKIDAPFFPYTEVPSDAADEASYRSKYDQNSRQPYQRGYSYNYGMHPFDVYVIADTQMQSMMGATSGGPPVADALRMNSDAIAKALGDTKAWGFDPMSQPRWTVTHLSENVWQRTATADLTFARYDLPKARPGPGVSEVDDRPVGPTFPGSSMAWMNPQEGERTNSHHKKLFRFGAIALFFLIAGAAAYAVMSEQEKKKNS